MAVEVEHMEKVYNRYSRYYDLIFGKVFHSGREMAPLLLDLRAGMNLLEVGVGTGLSLPMLPRNIQITGIDLSQKMLDQAAKRLEKESLNGNVQLIKMDATHLDLPDNSFDRVLAAYFISTVPDSPQSQAVRSPVMASAVAASTLAASGDMVSSGVSPSRPVTDGPPPT